MGVGHSDFIRVHFVNTSIWAFFAHKMEIIIISIDLLCANIAQIDVVSKRIYVYYAFVPMMDVCVFRESRSVGVYVHVLLS